jgi:SAM-dependent methyltransferase
LSSFAEDYDRYRPRPPDALLDLLVRFAGVERPALVVDLGSGTGLSTRAWVGRAERVVGVEPDERMRAVAEAHGGGAEYVAASASATGLPDGCADIVTCSQSLHWMEPEPTFAEVGRVLRPGGVFAAYDYDVPPLVQPDVDAAFDAHLATRGDARRRLGIEAGASTWPKERHVERIRASGHFRIAREAVCHGWAETDAEHLIGLAESIGGPRALFGDAAPEVVESFDALRKTAERVLGGRRWPMVLCYRLRVGIA